MFFCVSRFLCALWTFYVYFTYSCMGMLHIDRTLIRYYHSRPESTWEQWQWRSTPHSPNLQHYWSLTSVFSVISRTLVCVYVCIYICVGVLPFCRDAVGVFYSPSWLGKLEFGFLSPRLVAISSLKSPAYPTIYQ